MNLRSLLITTLLVTACAEGTSGTTLITTTTEPATTTIGEATASTAAPTTTAAPATTTTAVRIPLLRVEGGVKVEGPDTISVEQGRTVLFEVEADAADEIHVHGYDLFFMTAPGEVVVVEFVADATGIFEVELEESHLPLVNVEVTP
ncbi:MAG TPA: hypothetical protein VJ935_10255 [Acidimicrobiia bacterium]|nr:hypothetical protein [Acidimicrobiia bacterium]